MNRLGIALMLSAAQLLACTSQTVVIGADPYAEDGGPDAGRPSETAVTDAGAEVVADATTLVDDDAGDDDDQAPVHCAITGLIEEIPDASVPADLVGLWGECGTTGQPALSIYANGQVTLWETPASLAEIGHGTAEGADGFARVALTTNDGATISIEFTLYNSPSSLIWANDDAPDGSALRTELRGNYALITHAVSSPDDGGS